MVRYSATLLLAFCALADASFGCSCVGTERPCEYLRADAVFVGRVTETVDVRHPMGNNSYSQGYSMHFRVEESISGDLGKDVQVDTGNGGGDCGTPLRPGGRFLIFAYRDKEGALWTGMCSGNRQLTDDPDVQTLLNQYRAFVRKGTASIFGRVIAVTPAWKEDDVDDSSTPKPQKGIILRANSGGFSATTKTAEDGSYEFEGLPVGTYVVEPELKSGLDFDHEYSEDRYHANLAAGQCANISFKLEPGTRIRGHVTFPPGAKRKSIEVVAVPVHMKNLNQFSGKWAFIDENDRFDLWPLPPGDYYVGVNINSSPKEDSPFPPTYYPGATNPEDASIVHLLEGEIRELELPLNTVAKPRTIHFLAIGLDGKPLRTIYIQLEDMRHPGDASSYVNVDLDESGAGTVTIYAGYSYHLHGSHYVGNQDWCSKPVVIPAGTQPLQVRFVMDRTGSNCMIDEIDGLRK